MNISIEKKKFIEVVNIASRFSEKKQTNLPALSALLILAGDDGIKVRATNLEVGIDMKLEGKISSQGVIAVPATILQQIANSLGQEGTITLSHSGDVVSITDTMGKSSIKTIPYDDFPSIPFPEHPKNRFILSGAVIKTLFSTLASCASTSTVRPELSSVYIAIQNNTLTAVATDSFRLTEKILPLSNKGLQGTFLIPAKNALEISQALPDDDIIVSFDEHQCAFVSDAGMIVSRLTNAVYPDYKQIIPKESLAEVVVLRKDFESALKRTTIFSDTFQKIQLHVDPKNNTLSFFAKNNDIGESKETLKAKVSGGAIDISFNHRYLIAATTLTQTESLSLTISGIGRPMLIRGVGDNTLLYLVSPMNQ